MIGIFGGSGFYSLFVNPQEIRVNTPYGQTSDLITKGKIGGQDVLFIPRHGKRHSIPPHKINYRANIWAMKELGVHTIIAPCAAGSLKPAIKPGDFVICDQFIDRTSGRINTFYDGPIVTHISTAEPYCRRIGEHAYKMCKELGIPVHDKGTMVVIEGPRFSTVAESRWFSSIGANVINMTGYPECVLARELEMCYATIALITDYDAGLEGSPDIKPVTTEEVVEVFHKNIEKIKKLIYKMIETINVERTCNCKDALKYAVL